MVLLRDFIDSDIEQLVTILNDNSVTQFLSTKIASPYTKEHAQWWVNEGSQGELIKAITLDGVLVGCIGVYQGQFEYQKSGELGFWLAKEYWRKGITFSAVEQMTHSVFTNTAINRIYATVFAGNLASMQLLLKSGFHQEAVLQQAIYKNGRLFDAHIFAKIRACLPNSQ